MIYLDTSALVKLIRSEPESDELGDWLDDHAYYRTHHYCYRYVQLPHYAEHDVKLLDILITTAYFS